MNDKMGENITPGSLISIKSYNKTQYYYVLNCNSNKRVDVNLFTGYRVNKDFSINTYDKKMKSSRTFSYTPGEDEIKLINPMPPVFLESLRTLHFWVESVVEELGIIIKSFYVKELLRPVKFQNGSYGIIRNKILLGGSLEGTYYNAFEDLTYDELICKWESMKIVNGYEWKNNFDI